MCIRKRQRMGIRRSLIVIYCTIISITVNRFNFYRKIVLMILLLIGI